MNIDSVINKNVNDFISDVSHRYDIEQRELINIWDTKKNMFCLYMNKRGSKKDTYCNNEKRPDQQFCSLHMKVVNKKKKINYTFPVIKTKHLMALTENNVFYHIETRLVCKSLTDFTVIGKLSTTGCVMPLTSDDLNLCAKYKFQSN